MTHWPELFLQFFDDLWKNIKITDYNIFRSYLNVFVGINTFGNLSFILTVLGWF